MASDHQTAVLVTVLFAAVAAWSLARLAVGYSWVDRLSNAVHVVMAGVMLLMPWAAYRHVPVAAQIVFFSTAALWYVYLALFEPHAQAGPGEGHHDGPALLWYHAGMMVAMVWMAVAMAPLAAGVPSMPGMDMGMDMDMHSGAAGGGADAMAMTGSQPWAVALSWVFGVLLGFAAIWFFVRLVRQAVAADVFRGRQLIQIVDSLVNLLMAAGMAFAFIVFTA